MKTFILVLFFAVLLFIILWKNMKWSGLMYGGAVLKNLKMDNVFIEPISKQNIADVKLLTVNDNQKDYVANITDSLIQASFLKNWKGFALKDGDKVVGFGSYAKYEKQPGGIKIYKMIIDKSQQGKGYGTKLLNLLIDDIGSGNIWIDLHSDNEVAKRVYLKRFEVVSDDNVTCIMKLRSN